jgi:predicted  nucleic acid-binding Zn-ribbon protein
VQNYLKKVLFLRILKAFHQSNQFCAQFRRLLKGTEDELESWRKRYEIINTNLDQKELLINEMKRRHEEEISQAMAQTVDLEKLAQLEAEVSALKSQLAFCKIELSTLRTKCEQKSAEVVELRRQLDLETVRSRESKAEAQKCAAHADEQVRDAKLIGHYPVMVLQKQSYI